MASVNKRSELRCRGKRRAASVALAVALVASACQRSEYFGNTTPPDDNIFRFNVGPEPEYLDPALSTALYDARVEVLLFEGLTAKDPETLQPRPGMAERWDLSPDGRIYTFHLRRDALWSDATPVTAQDFVYSWTRVLDPKTGSRYAYYLYPVLNAQPFNEGKLKDPAQLGLRAVDDKTLEVRLREPVPYFLYLANHSSYYPVPRWAIERYGDHWTDPGHIVTNGPFLLREHRIHDRIVVDRNPNYWNRQEVRIGRVIAFSVDDGHTATNMYEAGMVDWLPYPSVPPEFLPSIRGRFRDLETFTQFALAYYCFNVTRPPLDNVMVRRALSLAIDRRAITDGQLRGGEVPTGSFVPSGFPGYPQPSAPVYDPKQARDLLAQAGFPDGRGFPSFEILTPPDRRATAEAVQQFWATNLNIHVKVHSEEYASFLKRWDHRDYDISSNRWIGDYLDPSTFTDLMESTSGNNNTGWKNAEYDRLLAAARVELDPGKRLEIFERGQEILLREQPVAPIYIMAANELVKPYVKGIYPATWDVLPLNHVWIDHEWQQHKSDPPSPRD
jgi:oligopeptide transport system substrate-binding protein